MISEPAIRPRGRLLRIVDVVRETSLHRATIYRLVKSGSFPRPLRLSPRRVAWAERDIEEWKITASSPAPS